MMTVFLLLITSWVPSDRSAPIASDAALVRVLEDDFAPILMDMWTDPVFMFREGVVLSEVVEIEEEGGASTETLPGLHSLSTICASVLCSHNNPLWDGRLTGFGPCVRSSFLRC